MGLVLLKSMPASIGKSRGVISRAANAMGFKSTIVNNLAFFDEKQYQAIKWYFEKKPSYTKEAPFYNEVVDAFRNMENNHTENICNKLNLSQYIVERHINTYLKHARNEIGQEFEIVESKMNFEYFD